MNLDGNQRRGNKLNSTALIAKGFMIDESQKRFLIDLDGNFKAVWDIITVIFVVSRFLINLTNRFILL